jgi:SAM-dependent methyltransferase
MPIDNNSPFSNYWKKIQLRQQAMSIDAKCINWKFSTEFNEVEKLIWSKTKRAKRLLDYGSGDQSLKKKYMSAGFCGLYETFDITPEFETTWIDPDEIKGSFDAILCLEVIEHMPLEKGLILRENLFNLLAPGGWLILSTPNPACIRSPYAADETHVHLYPLHDLLAWALEKGLKPEAKRIKLLPEKITIPQRLRLLFQKIMCYMIGVDRADGLLIMAFKCWKKV